MVKIILRDDDLNANCHAEDIDIFFNASDVFDEVILSFVPFPALDSCLGENDFKGRLISENKPLISKVKNLLKLKNVSISMHGISHSGYGEFSNPISTNEIKHAKKTLEKVFEVKVTTFTPPNNILSKKNYTNLKSVGFTRIISAFSNWPSERPLRFCYLDHFFRSSLLALKNKKDQRILRPLIFSGIREHPSFIAYNEGELKTIVNSIYKSCPNPDETIVVATHYWELWKTNPKELLKLPQLIRCKLRLLQ